MAAEHCRRCDHKVSLGLRNCRVPLTSAIERIALVHRPGDVFAGGARSASLNCSNRPSDGFSANEAAFIAERDSFFLATVSQTGWPYIQHRGGPPGILRVLDESTLGFAYFRGSRQYLTLGNLVDDDRVAVFLMDYARRRRLKILARMSAHDLKAEADLAARLATPDIEAGRARLHAAAARLRLELPQYITPRFTADEIEAAIAPLRARLRDLEGENARLRGEKESLS
jgi:predicted pyridoxine 5'-phosphate oxidase superfamily flavin-nucleotide-binding protein